MKPQFTQSLQSKLKGISAALYGSSSQKPPKRAENWDVDYIKELEGDRLGEALSLEAGQVSLQLRKWLLGGSATLAGSLLISAIIPVQNYVVASGEIEPAGEIQKVQHLEGGVIKEVPVKEGQRVNRGDILMKLDEGELGTREEQTATRITNLMLEQRQLRNALGQPFIDRGNFPSNPSPDVKKAFEDLQLANGRNIRREIRIATQRVTTLSEKRKQYLDEIELLKEQTAAYVSLDKPGAIPHTTVLEAQRRLASTETQLAELDGTIAEARLALEQLKNKLEYDNYQRLAAVTSEKAELQSTLRREESEVNRLTVRSPVNGIVKAFSVKVLGGIIAPGSLVAEVVPVGQQLMAFTRVQPKDIGQVRLGQNVELKVQAYDYTRYGTISGKVDSISAGTFQDEKTGEPYYKVRVVLERDYAGKDPSKDQLVPGMTLTADILTDKTSLLWYLLAPIKRGLSSAMK
jgi:HlyD family type I secretion membrane fusion protein